MNYLEFYKYELIETAVVLAVYIVTKRLMSNWIDKAAKTFDYDKPRVKVTKRLFNILLFAISMGFLLFIWGVKQNELVFFITSMLTVLGIAFFAQWSIISNVTATLVIYFNHPAKIGDTIIIMDKEFNIEARISDIGIFFMTLKTAEGEVITIPNNLFIQKMVKVKKV
jgi:small-conductance mechanosensitive channel